MSTPAPGPMLTTYDNPINPFENFIGWWKMDLFLGHDCCGLLARTANLLDYYDDEETEKETLNAMNEIVENEPLIYKIVEKKDYGTVKKNSLKEGGS